MARLTIKFFEGDYEVREPGRDQPLAIIKPRDGSDEAMARARQKAQRFIRDYESWQAAGAEPLCRPASNHARYQ